LGAVAGTRDVAANVAATVVATPLMVVTTSEVYVCTERVRETEDVVGTDVAVGEEVGELVSAEDVGVVDKDSVVGGGVAESECVVGVSGEEVVCFGEEEDDVEGVVDETDELLES